MNKKDRQERIIRLIQEGNIGTQEEIKRYLQDDGISVTQATLSRDLRELGLLKLRNSDGKLYYSLSTQTNPQLDPAIYSYVKKLERAGFMLVIHTNLGEADVLANIIDAENNDTILGTVAGADTLLVICKDEMVASRLEKEIRAQK
ncbi:MAG: arginine repressor [Streptococcus hyointestinalis]|uniref:Arginine repressor n=1 Tax=Streptococcus hyointestinalis TaxID=1337 RepID=A0A380KFR0_9STRE|nr:arginine repressor [Streptococcus hyointestinalis]MCI6871241.1 arginine repressor [Streptococcus hyointestinalis]MDD6385363.1 arginine repressor [Streptococcus hyointestinalis]MDD7356273.1 arginine repressor [Streptococcus hyointestinalis]MDY4554466.1 arginine repressor [Streptococcus hyointestinalis]SUN63883.1 transcriptional regulator of arginine metabolism [Streptococcus hyointestinalis]